MDTTASVSIVPRGIVKLLPGEKANTRLYLCGPGGIEAVRCDEFTWPAAEPMTRRPRRRWMRREGRSLWRSQPGTSPTYEKNRQRNLQRAKSRCRRLVKVNNLRHLWSLTLRDEPGRDEGSQGSCQSEGQVGSVQVFTTEEADQVPGGDKRLWRLFRYLKRRGIKAVATREFQKRGVIHYHVVVDQFILHARMWRVWSPEGYAARQRDGKGKGFDFVYEVGPRHGCTVGKAAGYVAKYITKDGGDERLRGRHSYLRSRGLVDPQRVDTWTGSFFDLLRGMVESLREDGSGPVMTDYLWDVGKIQAVGMSPPVRGPCPEW